MVAASYFARNIEALAVEGRLVVISLISGARAELNLGTLMAKRLTITGSTLRIRSVAQKALVAEGVRRNAWPLLEQKRVRPIIHATFPLAEASEAHRMMETSQHIGKIVLTV
jgi:NADPH:quinone reductase-like Zn-dependent oxidoreductase